MEGRLADQDLVGAGVGVRQGKALASHNAAIRAATVLDCQESEARVAPCLLMR